MKFAYDVPGLVAGWHCSDDQRYWDSANNRFTDLSGYGNHLEVVVGVPAFSTHGVYGRQGILLDNTCQLRFENPIMWQGTIVTFMRGHVGTGSVVLRPFLFGDAAAASSNGQLQVSANAGATALTSVLATPNGALSTGNLSHAEDTIFMGAYAMDQETRKAYRSSDFVTVTESAAGAVAGSGNVASLGWNGNIGLSGSVDSRYVRVGNNTGVIGNVAANATDYLHLFAAFLFEDNVLRKYLAQGKAFGDTYRSYFGIA